MFERARERGVKFNKFKCQFFLKEVKYVGHVITNQGIKLDTDKVEAVNKIKRPENSKEVSRFLGMVTYVSKFIPNLSKLTVNLRSLIRKNVEFQWLKQHDDEFQNLKTLLTKGYNFMMRKQVTFYQ